MNKSQSHLANSVLLCNICKGLQDLLAVRKPSAICILQSGLLAQLIILRKSLKMTILGQLIVWLQARSHYNYNELAVYPSRKQRTMHSQPFSLYNSLKRLSPSGPLLGTHLPPFSGSKLGMLTATVFIVRWFT